MAQLFFEITNQVITRTDKFKPVARSRNYLKAHFTFFTDEWTGVITAIFTKDDMSYEMILDNNNECLVPWELLTESGELYVSCFCDNLVTATPSRVTIYPTGYIDSGENTEPPTPNIYEQIIEYINNVVEDLSVIDGGTFDEWKE